MPFESICPGEMFWKWIIWCLLCYIRFRLMQLYNNTKESSAIFMGEKGGNSQFETLVRRAPYFFCFFKEKQPLLSYCLSWQKEIHIQFTLSTKGGEPFKAKWTPARFSYPASATQKRGRGTESLQLLITNSIRLYSELSRGATPIPFEEGSVHTKALPWSPHLWVIGFQ